MSPTPKYKAPYECLGIATTASEAEIKSAYKKLALLRHPDKAPPEKREEATANFQELQDACEKCLNWLQNPSSTPFMAQRSGPSPFANSNYYRSGWPREPPRPSRTQHPGPPPAFANQFANSSYYRSGWPREPPKPFGTQEPFGTPRYPLPSGSRPRNSEYYTRGRRPPKEPEAPPKSPPTKKEELPRRAANAWKPYFRRETEEPANSTTGAETPPEPSARRGRPRFASQKAPFAQASYMTPDKPTSGVKPPPKPSTPSWGPGGPESGFHNWKDPGKTGKSAGVKLQVVPEPSWIHDTPTWFGRAPSNTGESSTSTAPEPPPESSAPGGPSPFTSTLNPDEHGFDWDWEKKPSKSRESTNTTADTEPPPEPSAPREDPVRLATREALAQQTFRWDEESDDERDWLFD